MSAPRTLVRVLISTALCLALAASALSPLPEHLPAIALGQAGLYRLEVALAAFYGLLLLVTPTYSGLVAGRLPIEISTRGAKFAEKADRSSAIKSVRIEDLEKTVNDLTEALTAVKLKMERLQASTQRQ